MYATWYVLEDGTVADPNDVAPDDIGTLRHKSGVAVAVGPHGPRSRGVDLSKMARPSDAPSEEPEPARKSWRQRRDRQMSAAAGLGYETR